jgi:hypothetical protein
VLVPMDGEDPIFVNGTPPDMKTWITAHLASARPEILLPSSGGGANGNNGRTGARNFVITKEMAKDIGLVERVRADAAQAGVAPQYES